MSSNNRKNILSRVLGLGKKVWHTIIPPDHMKVLKQAKEIAKQVMALDEEYTKKTDEELKAKTQEFKEKLSKAKDDAHLSKLLDEIMVEAFATVREVAWRLRREKHYFSQIIGGYVTHKGMIAELGTGEGKTLVATMPAYLNALSGKGVHIITVNDYLAKRDADNMGRIFNFLGLTVGCLVSGMMDHQKKEAYDADVTYGTNHEFGFDYLRDNMKTSINELVQRPFNFCIIDEVDNILIDEARTPLIISGEAVESSELYEYADYIVRQLNPEDYETDEKSRSVYFTETGFKHLEEILTNEGVITENQTLFDEQNILLVHHINQAIKAHQMFQEGIQYIVKDGQAMIVDEFTGRIMDGRRYSDGLHQAIEAKEKLEIQKENQTLATITYQKFFELYPKKAGMTGTAMTESEEFLAIYKLLVVQIPPNKKVQRIKYDDKIYRTLAEKVAAVVEIVQDCYDRKQPILLGTVNVEKSEVFSKALNQAGIPHQVLNAKNHAYEASIIAQAGALGAVTIATNMAGRGTDIKLGGHVDLTPEELEDEEKVAQAREYIAEQAEKVKEVGGLYVLGTERHESRRIDNQLVGRSGRQGDPGTALFVVSLEDPLMTIFGGANLSKWLPTLGHKDGEAIEHPWITRAMSKAQKKVEAYHFDMRKNVLRYDSIINDQSKLIYKERYEFMTDDHVLKTVVNLKEMTFEYLFDRHFGYDRDTNLSDGNMHELTAGFQKNFAIHLDSKDIKKKYDEVVDLGELKDYLHGLVNDKFNEQKEVLGEDQIELISKQVCLQTLDMLWRQHLTQLENLRQGIGLRSYAQKDPLNEFKNDAFKLFESMMENFRETVVSCVFHHKATEEKEVDTFSEFDDDLLENLEEEFAAEKELGKGSEDKSSDGNDW